MQVVILGAGLAGVSLAYLLQSNPKISKITIIEKEKQAGGLCRSFNVSNINYDIGPHIIFSKNEEVLDFINKKILKNKVNKFRRSNMIIFEDKLVQYPFENDLSKLGESLASFCLNAFIKNGLRNIEPRNMLEFFYKTFGLGITMLYLQPYNEKIWKYPLRDMDTQMVERIPRPPNKDIIDSANGKTIDGYLHQLFFTYPKQGGIQRIIIDLIVKFNKKIVIRNEEYVKSVDKSTVKTNKNIYTADKIISTIPLNELTQRYKNAPATIKLAGKELKHNSIYICIINVKHNYSGDHFAFMIPNEDIVFHRISKLDFLGETIPGSTTYMAEVTVPAGGRMSKLEKQVTTGLLNIGFIKSRDDVNFIETKRFEYAYVIYDLMHKQNTKLIKEYFKGEGIELLGRFGEFEYYNMDKIIERAIEMAKNI